MNLFTKKNINTESIAAPRVELKNYELDQGKIIADIKIWNLVGNNIEMILLNLQCSSSTQDDLQIIVQLVSKDAYDRRYTNTKWYQISHNHIMDKGIAFQEQKDIHLEIDVNNTNLEIVKCTNVFVSGYR